MTKKKNEEDKLPVGRKSAYKDEYAGQALKLALLGATDKQMSDFFDVSEQTLNTWKKKYPEFLESLKNGKVVADTNVASKLYRRAVGAIIRVQQAHKLRSIYYDDKGKRCSSERIEVVNLSQEIPADPTSMIFWLKNRHPSLWRDKREITATIEKDDLEKYTDEELERIANGEKVKA